MQAYNASPLFSIGRDHSAGVAEYTARGYEAMGQGLASGIDKMVEKRDKLKEAESQDKTAATLYKAYAKVFPELEDFAPEFYGADKGTKMGLIDGLSRVFTGQRDDARQQSEADRRYGLSLMGAQQQAGFQNAQIDNMNADNVMAANRDAYDRQPDNQKPLYEQLPDGTTVVGAQGTKSGTRIFNFLPPREKGPAGPGELVRFQGPARVTSYGYANDETPDSNSTAGIGAFVPDAEQANIRAGKPSQYRLREGDLAFSPDVERQLRAMGVQPGEEVAVQFENGGNHIGRFMDRTSSKLTGRVDFYSPSGVRPDDGTRVTGFARIGPRPQDQAPAPKADTAPRVVQFPDPTDETGERKVPMQWDPAIKQWVPAPVQAAQAAPAAARKATPFWQRP